MTDPIQVVLTWLNSIKTDSDYLKPANFLLIILILVTGVVGLIALFTYIAEQRKIPILYFDRVWKQDSPQSRRVYFLRIKRQKGNGRAQGVEGFLSIKNKFDMIPTLWWTSKQPVTDIPKSEYLVLFRLEDNEKKITFPSVMSIPESQSYSLFANNGQFAYNEYSNEKLVVGIEATRGRIHKKCFNKKIKDIVKEAKSI
jgi:hypothetical protein